MSDFDESMFENLEEQGGIQPSSRPPGNRNFLVAVGVLGVIFLLALIALIVFGALILPRQRTARLEQAALINAQNTATAMAATQHAATEFAMMTASATPQPSETPLPSPTAVVVFATATPEAEAILAAELNARTQTVAALLTQAAAGDTLVGDAALTATALPSAGFVDDLGMPGLVGLSLLLIAVILLVRRLRLSAST